MFEVGESFISTSPTIRRLNGLSNSFVNVSLAMNPTNIIHNRDSIYSSDLDSSLASLGLTVVRTPYRSPQGNAFCERLIGTARRECLDFMIPIDAQHIRQILKEWVRHYDGTRPHSSLA